MEKWTKDSIWDVLSKNDAQLVKAFVKLVDYQEQDEIDYKTTIYRNNVGFNGCDGTFAAELYKGYKKWNRFTPRQLQYIRKMMKKYSGQLAKIANGVQ